MVEELWLLFLIVLLLHCLGFVGVQKDEEAEAEGYNEEGIPEVEVSIFWQYSILRLIITVKYQSRKVRKVVRTLKNIVE